MQKIMEKNETILKPWRPDKPASKGATAFHDAVFNSSWLKDILYELAAIVRPKIKNGDIVVDFGAGTGTSSILLLKHLKQSISLWLVDNSQSWLGKAYELLHGFPNVDYFILEKKGNAYATLAETIGSGAADHVISANTIHLIADVGDVFSGISLALKKGGTFTFQTGNFLREKRPEGALMIDDTVKIVHDIALDIVRTDPKFAIYRKSLDKRIATEESQRRFVFPDPRPIEFYLDALKTSGFKYDAPIYIPVKVRYDDWLNFLRVKRLQAGILPEVGGKEPSPQEEEDRDALITRGALKLFKDLENSNPLSDNKRFTIDIAYVTSVKE
ncbi:methyltransferase domain-containing protein [Candidatus Woesearchaeota archaeon]|nr:methyltransferase domain-containing protein [Candidatus Woesearchaeota archaeon]